MLALVTGCGHDESQHGEAHTADAAHDMHDEHAAHVAIPQLEPGQRWPTDEPLREAMLRIRAAVETSAQESDKGRLPANAAHALANAVDENVKFMIANCKLAPEPDAALHVLIGRMLNAAAALHKNPDAADGVPQLRAVLHDYSMTFDHAGWDATQP